MRLSRRSRLPLGLGIVIEVLPHLAGHRGDLALADDGSAGGHLGEVRGDDIASARSVEPVEEGARGLGLLGKCLLEKLLGGRLLGRFGLLVGRLLGLFSDLGGFLLGLD